MAKFEKKMSIDEVAKRYAELIEIEKAIAVEKKSLQPKIIEYVAAQPEHKWLGAGKSWSVTFQQEFLYSPKVAAVSKKIEARRAEMAELIKPIQEQIVGLQEQMDALMQLERADGTAKPTGVSIPKLNNRPLKEEK